MAFPVDAVLVFAARLDKMYKVLSTSSSWHCFVLLKLEEGVIPRSRVSFNADSNEFHFVKHASD